ncbi:allophanate hydrolase [Rhizobium sp. RU20A]|uniref:allophanate hydrolase n=1 Tax=Rhizobium sp. RU20A TaxID=1907412 RepID=UPI000955AFAF|nr:allophanate hydrolase [Rhizobium sp. RU20A]SIR37675.1 allophanate hydrolase [Rhizobium sp. RU20A]
MTPMPVTLAQFRAAYAAGLSPKAVIEEVYRRIAEAADPGIFIHLAPIETVLAAAEALGPYDPAKPLYGIPFAVKDNIDVSDMPTTCACPAFELGATADAFVVAKLKAAGALPIGKTNLDQFATGLVGVRSPYPIPKNAIDPAIVPGGSSSGSAVAVARGIVPFALGTDTAGSGRVPAALNNIVGLKPTLGSLSASGMVPACRTLDTISIFALTVEDAFAAYSVAAGYDASDAYSRDLTAPVLETPAAGFAIGIPDAASRLFFGDVFQEASFEATLATLEGLGHRIVPLDFSPLYRIAALLYEGAWVAERYAAIETVIRTTPEVIFPVTRKIIERAETLTAADAFRDIYRLAALKRAAEPLIAAADLFCVPTIPCFFSVEDLEQDPVGPNSKLGTYTNFVNLLDLCGIAVPVTARADDRPGSVTLLGPAGQDGRIAGIAARLQADAAVPLGATGRAYEPTEAPAPAAGPGEIAIALVGAHMRGLPLNGEVTRLGGRFLAEAVTAPEYRLHALAGGPPRRPGLVRVEDGHPIALELWAIPNGQFGAFMKGVPAPLAIGTVKLADGTTVKGFLCETAGLAGSQDITAFGGWRAYLASL